MKSKYKSVCLAAVLSASSFAADNPASVVSNGVRHQTVGPEDVVHITCSTFQYCSVVMPEQEKALTYLCGDMKHFDVQIIEGAERFVNIKPTPGAHATDIQILTDHNHEYPVAVEIGSPTDVKVFIDSTDTESLSKPASLVSAASYRRLEDENAQLRKETEDTKTKAAAEVKQDVDSAKVSLVHNLKHEYRYKHDEAPFHITDVATDGKFLYVTAKPEEVASFYALHDGKPDLVETEYHDGVYTIRQVPEAGFFQIGKKKTEIRRAKQGG